MWHVLHLIVRPIEVVLGVFCVFTAVLLYPDEEGKIQSQLEDFWLHRAYLEDAALSRHAAFMAGVARLETRMLDRIFGARLFSIRSLAMSYFCSIGIVSSTMFWQALHHLYYNHVSSNYEYNECWFWAGLLFSSLVVGIASLCIRNRRGILATIVVLTLGGSAIWIVFLTLYSTRSLAQMEEMGGIIFFVIAGGFACDVGFIACTRRLVRWAGQMVSFSRVLATVLANFLLAALLIILPILLNGLSVMESWEPGFFLSTEFVALSNAFDALLALLFFALAVMLLVHRALWPLLTRTLFRIQDIGTKGRRAILTTAGFALLAAGTTGKVPELLQKVIEKLGG